MIKLTQASVEHLCSIPLIVPYSVHLNDATHSIMASEMHFLDIKMTDTVDDVEDIECTEDIEDTECMNDVSDIEDATGSKDSKPIKYEHAAALQRTIHTHQLPPNLTNIQLKALSARMRTCERSALSCSILYVCVSCVMANQQTICRKGRAFPTRGQCKRDLDSNTLLCSVCQSHSVVSISTIGRIVSLRNYRFYLAPCCCTVQIYTGRGNEFQRIQTNPASNSNNTTVQTNPTCPHTKQPKAQTKQAKRRCELCSNVAIPDPHHSVDHLSGEQHCTYLCQRHTPHQDNLKHVTNWRQLQEEVRRRDRPLFSMRTLRRT